MTPLSYRITEMQSPGARLVVLGLPVGVRVQVQLRKCGFVETGTAASPGVLDVRGDLQLLAAHWRQIQEAISKDPSVAHEFVSATGTVLPVVWRVSNPRQIVTHILSGPSFVVTTLLNQKPEDFVRNIMSDALFAEIYAGTEGWIARAFNKKISFRVTRFLVRTAVTPNQITVANLILGLVGCVFFLSPHYLWQVLGALLLQCNSILDGCDGEVARLKGLTSKIGGWMDTIADDLLNNAMFLCLILGVYQQTGNELYWRFGWVSLLASIGVTALIYQNLIANGKDNAAHVRLTWDKSAPNPLPKKSGFDAIKPVLKRDFFIFVVCVFVILNLRHYLVFFLVPVWGAFFLYLASFLYGIFAPRTTHQTETLPNEETS